jgi:high affinity Mn2+ porin
MIKTAPCAAWKAVLAALMICALAHGAKAQEAPTTAPTASPTAPASAPDDRFALHFQTTFVEQGHDAFASPYAGANSLGPDAEGRETWDATLFAGLRPWRGAEVWINPEVDQGFGLSNTLGVAGFPSGEAYKVGKADPYFRLQRFFIRQTLDLGGVPAKTDADLNQFAEEDTQNRIVMTVGKMSVGDIFDANDYAHNPKGDFLNWSIIDAGTFDYAADSWGYSAGAVVELYEGRWTLRGGYFLLSNVPNSEYIDTRFDQFQLLGEIEERHSLFGQAGKLVVTGFLSRGQMGRYDDAIAYAQAHGGPVNTALVRHEASRPGISVDLQQAISKDLGGFLRAGWAKGDYETYEFSDIDESVSGGLSLKGRLWGRTGDTVGLAGVVNVASSALKDYLAAGGLGVLVGDGKLPHPQSERIAETYYDIAAFKGADVALDYQWVTNPAYNRDRGPVSVFGIRLHFQY